MRFNYYGRLRRLEARKRERLAVAAAEASLPVAEPQSLEELRQLDTGAMTALCLERIRPRKVKGTEEFTRYYAQYVRMPFRELAGLYRQLKHRQQGLLAERGRMLAERRAQAEAELAQPEPDLTKGWKYDEEYKKAIVFRRLMESFVWG